MGSSCTDRINNFTIIFLYITERCIPKSLLDDSVSISVLEGSTGKLVEMLLGVGVYGVVTSTAPGKLSVE